MRYTFIEKLCLSLYHACIKLRHYLLSSTCIVVLQKPILSGRIGKWAYTLIEYDLACEPLKSMKAQIVADFIVEHRINDEHDIEIGHIFCTPWKLCLMDRFVMMGEELVLSLYLQVVLFFSSQTD